MQKMLLASANRRSENVRIQAIVIPELKFSDVQREIFGADFVEAADEPELGNAQESSV